MRQKTKITIAALAVMLFMALAVTFISFIFADNSSGDGSANLASNTADTTIIDYIIQNSNDSSLSDNNKMYRIVEIGAGTPSALKAFATGSGCGFESYVIDGNRTIEATFAAGNIKYTYMNAKDITSTSTHTITAADGTTSKVTDYELISEADMLYISNYNLTSDGAIAAGYSTNNDLSEELFNLIQPLAVGSYIPVIIDVPSKSGSNTVISTSNATVKTKVGEIIAGTYDAKGKYYATFGYDAAGDPGLSEFFRTSLSSDGYVYSPINPMNRTKYYTQVSSTEGDTSYLARMLVVNSDGSKDGDNTLSSKFFTFGELSEGDLINSKDSTAITVGESQKLYNISNLNTAYNSRYGNYIPGYALVDYISIDELVSTSTDAYDMVFIETDLKDYETSSTLEQTLINLMKNNVHVVYDTNSKLDASAEPDDAVATSTEASGTVYEKLYNYVSSNGIAKYDNVLLTYKEEMDRITSGTAAAGKTLADLINASSYRGIGGAKSTSNKFSVLEIQPCYPVDTALVARNQAQGRNAYYNDATNILNGYSKDEIIEQLELEGEDVSDDKSTYEYYAWELSRAKIADALNMDASQITLTQMSTEELSSYKGEILGNYDLVYIGGNTSALKTLDEYYSYIRVAYSYNIFGTSQFKGKSNYDELVTSLPVYTMYSHNGDYASTDISFHSSSNTSATGTTTIGTEISGVKYNGKNGNPYSFTQLNGNDLSNDNLTELEDYVAAGMPILFSSDLTLAYGAVVTNGYAQNSIDPDSNMATLLKYCYDKQGFTLEKTGDTTVVKVDNATSEDKTSFNENTNIMWNFDASDGDYVSSENGLLSTYASMVHVLKSDMRTYLKTLYNSAATSKRPKLVITSSPEQYNINNTSTITTTNVLKYVVDKTLITKTTSKYTLNLYIDDDGNSLFSADECVATASNGESLSYELETTFNGPVYWKLELVDDTKSASTEKKKASETGLAYVKQKATQKQEVSVLQILPGTRVLCGFSASTGTQLEGGDSGSANGLYFCTVCQQSYKNNYYNPFSSTGYGGWDYYYGSSHFSDKNVSKSGYAAGGTIKAGLHEHNFGIVSYSESLSIQKNGKTIQGIDDWYHNIADDLSDDFEFDVQILYVDDFENYAKEIAGVYDGLTDDEAKAKQAEYQKKATAMEALYEEKKAEVQEASDALDELIQYMIDCQDASDSKFTSKQDPANGVWPKWQSALSDTDTRVKALKNMMQQQTYSELFAMDVNMSGDLSVCYPKVIDGTYKTYKELYNNWVTLHDEMLILKGGYYVNAYTYPYFKEMSQYKENPTKYAKYEDYIKDPASYYKDAESGLTDGGISSCDRIYGYQDYEKLAGGLDWLNTCYTTVCIGPSENFGNDDISSDAAINALLQFVADSGQLVLFHDTFSGYADGGSYKLTAALRDLAGANKYHADSTTADTTYLYTKYSTTDAEKYPSSIYFTSNLSNDSSDSKYSGYYSYVKKFLDCTGWLSASNQYAITGLTDTYLTSNSDSTNSVTDDPDNPLVKFNADGSVYSADAYRYAVMNWGKAATWSFSAASTKADTTYATDKATKNNDAIVNMYPFALADEINIGGTHPQALALDVEDDDVTVLYSLAGGTSAVNQTSILAADPGDGSDNYFIYARKNIYYCGAGHGKITGMQKDNLNERYLYMNIICNSVRQSAIAPTIGVYDDASTTSNLTNNIVKKQSDGSYEMSIDDDAKYPSFSFKVGVDEKSVLTKVEVYYDLDYGKTIKEKDSEGNVVYNTDGSASMVVNTSDDYDSENDYLIASWGVEGSKNTTFTADLLGHICDDVADTKHGATKHSASTLLEKYTIKNLVTGADESLSRLYLRTGDTTTYGSAEPDYFAPYDGNYTYIVIKATARVTTDEGTVKTKTTYKRIKITRKDHLFNLT